MDDFTWRHLCRYADDVGRDTRESDEFCLWVKGLDPVDLAYYTASDGPGWPGAYREFERQANL